MAWWYWSEKTFGVQSKPFYLLAILAHVIRDLVRRRLLGIDLCGTVDADHVVSHRVSVEVKGNVRVGLDIAHLLARDRVDDDELAVPPEPNRHDVRVPVATHGRDPDDQLSLEPRLNVLVRRRHCFEVTGCLLYTSPSPRD